MSARKNDVEVSQRKKDECNARAQKIVCELIDGIKTEEDFLEQLRWVNQNHYEDIVEERAISKMCGYPVCEGKLGLIPRKKYHISVSQKKVYDITERKLFCSNECYKASTYLKIQLHTSPLWLGNREEPKAFSLLRSRTELVGEEVDFKIQNVKISPSLVSEATTPCKVNHNEVESCTFTLREDLEFHAEDESNSEEDDSRNKIEDETSEPSPKFEENVVEQEIHDSNSDSDLNINKIDLLSDPEPESKGRIHIDPDKSIPGNDCYVSEKSKSINTKSTKLNKTVTRRPKTSNESIADSVRYVESSLREWMTFESVRRIFGDQTVINMLTEKSRVLDSENNASFYASYRALCRKLGIFEFDEERKKSEPSECALPEKQLVDFEASRKMIDDMAMKVEAFYRGDKRVTFNENVKEVTIGSDDEQTCTLPIHYIETHQKSGIRRRIVLQKLNLVLADLCDTLALNRNIFSQVKELVITFNLGKNNITFKPLEWNLIALILLKLLSVEDHHIRTSIQNKLVNTLLSSYHLEPDYLEMLCRRLTDLDSVVIGPTRKENVQPLVLDDKFLEEYNEGEVKNLISIDNVVGTA